MSNYEVGYKKPPIHSQFKKGVCPNPKGRGKRLRYDSKNPFQEIWDTTVEITDHGKRKRISKKEYMIRSWVKSATQGNIKSADLILDLYYKNRSKSRRYG
jgi:Family of unknown function (DUF5681)